MRIIALSLFILVGITVKSQDSRLSDFFQSTNAFLENNVSNGKVDYSSIQSNSKELTSITQLIAAQSLEKANEVEKKAFYINAYNLLVIESIVKKYPINSPKSISGFFDSKKHTVAGEQLTVNQIEKEKLNPVEDPRLHFVLVCAALSCPIIESRAYFPSTLDQQLAAQAKKAINNTSFIKVNNTVKEVELSKIFSWYKKDFTSDGKSLLEFVNSYRKNKISDTYKIKFYEYDWTLNDNQKSQILDDRAEVELSNLKTFTPSALYKKGQYEINVFNSIYSQQEIRDKSGETVKLGGTQSFFTSLIQFTTGINQSGRINFGVDVAIVKAKYSNQEESGLAVFNSEGETFARTVLSSIAPRIKFKPFKSIPRLSVQSSLSIPIAKGQQKEGFVAHDRYSWFTQVFYDKSFGENLQLFLETDFLYRIKYNEANSQNFFRIPLSAFLSYFPSSKSTIYVFSQYSPKFETVSNSVESTFGLSEWFTQVGIGAKYQLTQKFGIELSYADFALSRNSGAGYNLNFGIKYIYR
ncbi:MAG: DUF547 domain-containing protein [Flavobacteriales bacterium]|nr:DUF547 domain-containing protein [Flavobacteriales bacterium]